MMTVKAVSTVLSGALALGSFLCVGMGMDMGAGWVARESHDCCPGRGPQKPDSNCCLLLPGAVSASVSIPAPHRVVYALSDEPVLLVVSSERSSVLVRGPPGSVSPAYSSPAVPRAPPVA